MEKNKKQSRKTTTNICLSNLKPKNKGSSDNSVFEKFFTTPYDQVICTLNRLVKYFRLKIKGDKKKVTNIANSLKDKTLKNDSNKEESIISTSNEQWVDEIQLTIKYIMSKQLYSLSKVDSKQGNMNSKFNANKFNTDKDIYNHSIINNITNTLVNINNNITDNTKPSLESKNVNDISNKDKEITKLESLKFESSMEFFKLLATSFIEDPYSKLSRSFGSYMKEQQARRGKFLKNNTININFSRKVNESNIEIHENDILANKQFESESSEDSSINKKRISHSITTCRRIYSKNHTCKNIYNARNYNINDNENEDNIKDININSNINQISNIYNNSESQVNINDSININIDNTDPNTDKSNYNSINAKIRIINTQETNNTINIIKSNDNNISTNKHKTEDLSANVKECINSTLNEVSNDYNKNNYINYKDLMDIKSTYSNSTQKIKSGNNYLTNTSKTVASKFNNKAKTKAFYNPNFKTPADVIPEDSRSKNSNTNTFDELSTNIKNNTSANINNANLKILNNNKRKSLYSTSNFIDCKSDITSLNDGEKSYGSSQIFTIIDNQDTSMIRSSTINFVDSVSDKNWNESKKELRSFLNIKESNLSSVMKSFENTSKLVSKELSQLDLKDNFTIINKKNSDDMVTLRDNTFNYKRVSPKNRKDQFNNYSTNNNTDYNKSSSHRIEEKDSFNKNNKIKISQLYNSTKSINHINPFNKDISEFYEKEKDLVVSNYSNEKERYNNILNNKNFSVFELKKQFSPKQCIYITMRYCFEGLNIMERININKMFDFCSQIHSNYTNINNSQDNYQRNILSTYNSSYFVSKFNNSKSIFNVNMKNRTTNIANMKNDSFMANPQYNLIQTKDLPFHNIFHAIDVMKNIFVFLIESDCVYSKQTENQYYFSEIDLLSSLMAGLLHDMGHTGFNNDFLVRVVSDQAITYNDLNVLENSSAKLVSELLINKTINIFDKFHPLELRFFRKRLIDGIFATSMTNHNKIMSTMKNKASSLNIKFGSNTEKLIDPEHDDFLSNQQEVLDLFIHVSDFSYNSKKFKESSKWTYKLFQELWNQGRYEKEFGFRVSMLCDRTITSIPNAQITFFRAIVIPSYNLITDFIPILSSLRSNIKRNLEKWEELEEKENEDNDSEADDYSEVDSDDENALRVNNMTFYKKHPKQMINYYYKSFFGDGDIQYL